ncbi:MAG: N-acetyltransferase [Campylobacterales bacterium]|nr:N-acetyltransferase [Campylobacterales bacterium]
MIILTKATLDDIDAMQELVSNDVKSGIILNRSDDEIATNIRSYILAKDEKQLVGYLALHIHSKDIAEIRSLIVHPDFRKKNIGRSMIEYALDEAQKLGIKREVLALTYIADFFKKLGFIEIEKDEIPEHKIWADCIKCIHFPVCNEVALVYRF